MSQSSRRHSVALSSGSPAVWPATPPRRLESAAEPLLDRKNGSSSPLALVVVECRNVHGVEALANSEQEDANDDEGDQNRKGHADLYHQRHAFGARSRQHQSVLKRHESHHLTNGISARHHDQKPKQYYG